MRKILSESKIIAIVFAAVSPFLFLASSCPDDENLFADFLGWSSDEQTDEIPQQVNPLGGTGNLPSSVDLSPYLPPVKDQYLKGTCVAWASGYYTRTAMNAINNGYSPSDLQDPSRQISPEDLYNSIPSGKKDLAGPCNSTYFEAALDMLQSRGAVSLSEIPYQDHCGNFTGQNASASVNKIKSYRKISLDINTIKYYLYNKFPIMFGAEVYESFKYYQGGNYTANSGPKYGGHAMTIIGYDDSRNAFHIVNSWGTQWGENGYMWIDYNFFVNQFCNSNAVFIQSVFNGNDPADNNNNSNNNSGTDLSVEIYSDFSTGNYTYVNGQLVYERVMTFNIFNTGNAPILPNGYKISLVAFNAYDANLYLIMANTSLVNSLPANTCSFDPNGEQICNITIPTGSDLAETYNGSNNLTYTYYVPSWLNGPHFIALIADSYNLISESNEQNNIYYTSNTPKFFTNGYAPKTDAGGTETSLLKSYSLMQPDVNLNVLNEGTGQQNYYENKEILQAIINNQPISHDLPKGSIH